MSLRFAPGPNTALLIFMLTVSAARANTPEQIFAQVSPSVEGQSLNFAMPVDWISELPKRAQAEPVVTKKSKLDAFVRAYILQKEKEGPSFLDKAEVMRKDKNWHKLIELAQQWVKNEPENDTSWFYLANAFANIKQYDQAIQAYRESLRIKPADASVWIELGKVYVNIKQYDKAITAYLEALRIQPADISKEAYKFVIVGEPFFLRAYYHLGNVYIRTNQYDQGIQAFREALRIQPEDTDAWNELGFAYYIQGQHDKVREIYQTLRKLDPAMAKTYFNALILP